MSPIQDNQPHRTQRARRVVSFPVSSVLSVGFKPEDKSPKNMHRPFDKFIPLYF